MVIKNRKRDIIIVIAMVLLGWLIYSPMCTNYFTNGDGVSLGLVYRWSSDGVLLGRTGIGIIIRLFGHIVSPSLSLISCLFLYAFSSVLVIYIFNIRSYFEQLLLILFMLLVPNTSSLFTYYYNMVAYSLALFLSILAVCLLTKINNIKNTWLLIISALLIGMSLTLYQSYISVTVILCMIYALRMLLENNTLKNILIFIIRGIVGFVTGVGGYLLHIRTSGIELTSGRSFDKMGQIDISQLPGLCRDAYYNFYQYFFGDQFLTNSFMYRNVLNLLIVVAILAEVVYLVLKNKLYKGIWRVAMIVVVLLIMPIGFELSTIIAPGVDAYGTTGILLVPAMAYMYLLPIAIMHREMNKIPIKMIYIIPLVILIWNLVLFTYAFENVMWLNYNKTMTLCDKISNAVDEQFGYEPGMIIMITGDPEKGNYPCAYEELNHIVKGSLAIKGMVWKGGRLQNVCYSNIWKYYKGIDYAYPGVDEYNKIIETDEYKNMEIFPNEGSVNMIDGIVVIKMS